MQKMISRREFLKLLGFAGGMFLLSIPKLVSGLSKTNSTSRCDDPEKFDIWGGFVLLEEDAYLPSFVEIPSTPILGIETRPCCATYVNTSTVIYRFDWVDPSPNPCPAKKE